MFFDPDRPDVPVPDAVDLVVEAADLMSILAAQRLLRVDGMREDALANAAAVGRKHTEIVERGVRLELAAALRITESAAERLLYLAEAVVHRYPAVLEALERARVTEQHARILVTEFDKLHPDLRDRLLPEAMVRAETEPVGRFARSLRKLIETARAATLTERHQQAVTERRVVFEAADDAMAWLHLYGPAVEARAVFDRLTRMGKALVASDSLAAEAATAEAAARVAAAEATGAGIGVGEETATHPAAARADSTACPPDRRFSDRLVRVFPHRLFPCFPRRLFPWFPRRFFPWFPRRGGRGDGADARSGACRRLLRPAARR